MGTGFTCSAADIRRVHLAGLELHHYGSGALPIPCLAAQHAWPPKPPGCTNLLPCGFVQIGHGMTWLRWSAGRLPDAECPLSAGLVDACCRGRSSGTGRRTDCVPSAVIRPASCRVLRAMVPPPGATDVCADEMRCTGRCGRVT